MFKLYDKEGNEIDGYEWRCLLEDPSYRVIAFTELDDGTVVSTVWTGVAVQVGPNGPMIFETLLHEAGSKEEEKYRYATQEEALKHHKALVETNTDEYKPVNRWRQVINET